MEALWARKVKHTAVYTCNRQQQAALIKLTLVTISG